MLKKKIPKYLKNVKMLTYGHIGSEKNEYIEKSV